LSTMVSLLFARLQEIHDSLCEERCSMITRCFQGSGPRRCGTVLGNSSSAC